MQDKEESTNPAVLKLINNINRIFDKESYDWMDIGYEIKTGDFTAEERKLLTIKMLSRNPYASVFIEKGTISPDLIFEILEEQENKRMTFSYNELNHFYTIFKAGNPIDVSEHERMALKMVSKAGQMLQHIPVELRSPAICEMAVRNYGPALKFVPEEHCSAAICRFAIRESKEAIPFIPDRHQAIIAEFYLGELGLDLNSEEKKVFINTFSKLNQHYQSLSPATKSRLKICQSFNEFFSTNKNKIFELYKIFGPSSMVFLKSLLISTPVTIERFLDSYIGLNNTKEIELFANKMHEIAGKNQWTKEQTKHCALLISFFNQIEDLTGLQNIKQPIIQYLKENNFNNMGELQKVLYEDCKNAVFQYLGIDSAEINMDKFNKKVPLEWFIQLMIGIKSVHSEKDLKIIAEMLKADFKKEGSFAEFSRDLNQDPASMGFQLATHNQGITEELTAAGIYTEKAKAYQTKKQLTFGAELPKYTPHKAIWSLIQAIENKLKNSSTEDKAARKMIENFKQQILKGSRLENTIELPDKVLLKINNQMILLNKLTKLLTKISNKEEMVPSLESLTTAMQQLADENQEMMQMKEKQKETRAKEKQEGSKAPKQKTQRFSVQQWDKNRMDTLFLGNQLSCCLATNGTQFRAILERRVDDACFMHVIINEETGEPVCGNWLFFAKDKDNEKDVYVVANFFEIKSSYCVNKVLNDYLVNSLVEYTGRFAEEVGAKGFLLRPLTYGNIEDFHSLETQKISIEKVGGYFDQFETRGEDESPYYLEALKLNTFYHYETPKLTLSQEVEQTTSNPKVSTTDFRASVKQMKQTEEETQPRQTPP